MRIVKLVATEVVGLDNVSESKYYGFESGNNSCYGIDTKGFILRTDPGVYGAWRFSNLFNSPFMIRKESLKTMIYGLLTTTTDTIKVYEFNTWRELLEWALGETPK